MIPQNNQQIKQFQTGQLNFGIQYREQDLYPYTKQQFLYQTFNYNQDYIQAFLALSHEIKLKMYLLVEQAKIYGHITDKQSYQDILFKIANASRILKGQGALPEKQLNTNSMQDKINQLCDYEFKKLDINDQWSSPRQYKQFKSNELQNKNTINDDIVTFPPKNQQFNISSPSNNDQEDFDQFVGVPNHEQNNQKQSQSFQKDNKSDEDWDWANEQQLKQDLIDFSQQSNKQNKNLLPTFDQLYGTSKPKQPQLPPMKFAWTQTFNEQEKYKEKIFDMSIDQDEDFEKNKQISSNSTDNNFNPFIKQNFDSFRKPEVPVYENIFEHKNSQKKIEENEPSIGNSLPQEDQQQFLEFVSEAATGAQTNSTHTDVATSVSTGFNIISGLSLNPLNNEPYYNDGIDYSALYPNNNIAQQSKIQQNVLDLQFLLTNPQKQHQLNYKNEIEKSKSTTQQKEVWNVNKQIINSYSEKQEHYHRNDKNKEQNNMQNQQRKQFTEINKFQQIQNPFEQQIKINLQEDQQFGQFQENPPVKDIMMKPKQQIKQKKILISQNFPQQAKNSNIRQQKYEGIYRQKRVKTLSEMDEQADDDQSSNNQNHMQNNQQFQIRQQLLRSQNLNYSSKGIQKKQKNYTAQKTDFISKSYLSKHQFIEHPLLKPLLIKHKTTELERQIITNSFQYNVQFYEKAIQFVQALGYTSCPIEYYLKQQFQYVHKIKQLTEMYANAVQEEQQEKVREALKKSKQYYSLLNGKKTIQYMNRFFNKMGKGVLYQLAEIVLQSGVSIQHIEKFISTTRNSDTFISNLVTLYIFQKNNNIESIPAYASKLVQYLLIQYQQYRTQQGNLKNLQQSQQQLVAQSQIYTNYVIRLGIISAICRRMIVLMKVCSKGGGNLVKCLKACKQLQANTKQISEQKNKLLPILWTEQEEQNIIPRQYSNSVINAIKRQQADTILTVLTNIVSQKPVCRLCFGSANLEQMRGTKVHIQCWNLYKKVSELIKQ